MTTYDLCKAIQLKIANKTVLSLGSFARNCHTLAFSNSMLNLILSILEQRDYKAVDPNDLTISQAEDLGFMRAHSAGAKLHIPIWLTPFLVEEFEGIKDSYKGIIKQFDVVNDDDIKCLCTSYGVHLQP